MTTLPEDAQVLSPNPKAERGGGCPQTQLLTPGSDGQGKEQKEKGGR